MKAISPPFAIHKLTALPARLAALGLLALALAACGSPAAEPTLTAAPSATMEPPPTKTLAPTATPTQEPTPTPTQEPIIETDAVESQQWWLRYWREVEKAAARTEGCEVSYEIVNARELGYVNTIPWTVDQHGETVQGVIPSLCGEGAYLGMCLLEDHRYFVDSILADGFMSYTLGPDYVACGYETTYVSYVGLSPDKLGGLTQSGMDAMRAPFGAYPPAMVVPADPDLVNAITNFGYGRWR